MWSLTKPSIYDAKNDLELAFPDNPKVTIKRTEKDELKSIYDHYDENGGKENDFYKNSKEISDEKADTIKNAYSRTHKNKDLNYMRVALFKNANHRCVLCGLSDKLTLDHFLPESIYKLVAINRQNLVPTCFNCNNIKRAKPANEFIHAYYDKLPTTQFLYAITNIHENGLNVTLTIHSEAFINGELNPLYNNCISQIKHIELEDRLNDIISNFLVQTFMNDGDINSDDILELTLKKIIKSHIRLYGINDWRTAVLISLSENDNFSIDFLKLYMRNSDHNIFD